MSSRQLSFHIQDINCSHITYFTIRLSYLMWVETHDIEVATDKQGKAQNSMNGEYKIARGAVEILRTKLR